MCLLEIMHLTLYCRCVLVYRIGNKGHPVSGRPKKTPLLSDLNEPPHPAVTVAFTFQVAVNFCMRQIIIHFLL